MVVLVLGAVAAMAMLVGGRGADSGFRDLMALPENLPLLVGDELTMELRSQNHTTSCPVSVLQFTPPRRVLGVPCNGQEAVEVDPATLFLKTYAHQQPQQGDVVLLKSRAWQRAVIRAPEAGDRFRVRALDAKGTESSVARQDLVLVQHERMAEVRAPLPADAPLQPGDVLWQVRSGVLTALRLASVEGPNVTASSGYVSPSGEFVATDENPAPVKRAELRARVVRAGDTLAPGIVLLAGSPGRFRRLTLVSEEPGYSLSVRDSEGKTEHVIKQGLLVVGTPSRGVSPVASIPSLSNTASPALATSVRVVAGMRSKYASCFNAALKVKPAAQGSLRLKFTIGPSGAVTKVDITPTGTLPKSMLDCVREETMKASFEPADAGERSMETKLNFEAH